MRYRVAHRRAAKRSGLTQVLDLTSNIAIFIGKRRESCIERVQRGIGISRGNRRAFAVVGVCRCGPGIAPSHAAHQFVFLLVAFHGISDCEV